MTREDIEEIINKVEKLVQDPSICVADYERLRALSVVFQHMDKALEERRWGLASGRKVQESLDCVEPTLAAARIIAELL